MDSSQSTRSCSPVRTSDQRGFVLVSALIIAVLYLALIELLLMDGVRALQEAQRMRSRVVAGVLAENGAELAAEAMVAKQGASVEATDVQGDVQGNYKRFGDQFELTGSGKTAGVAPESAHVAIQGRLVGALVKIDYTTHSQ